MRTLQVIVLAALTSGATAVCADVETRKLNNGNLILEDIPEIPAELVSSLNRYQNTRSAVFAGWTGDGEGVFVKTRFGDVYQIHRVDMPGGARYQLTFDEEPIGSMQRQPEGSKIVFTRDAGGSEFSQLFLFDPDSGQQTMLTDGESRNTALIWDRDGRRIAYQSTRRNGVANDIWVMDPEEPDAAAIALESQDGSWWEPREFSASGSKVLLREYVSIADSRVHLVDLDSGAAEMLAGGAEITSANYPVAFDDEAKGFWLITDQDGEFSQLAWQALDRDASPEIVTGEIPWNIDTALISHDRKRMAFVVNENGRSALYLMDTASRAYQRVDNIPVGLIGAIEFSPDDSRLGMVLNTPRTPNDTFVLDLGQQPLESGKLTRWTYSEVGGLDTSSFAVPELVSVPTFDKVGDEQREVPAWVYKPTGSGGPHPVVIYIHGGPEGQSRPAFVATFQMWIEKLGVAVILPNVRGSTGYGKTYTSLDNGFKREDSVRDIGAVLDWIETQADLDSERVAVYGGSYGGYMVLASAVHYSDRLSAVVDVVGISSFVTFLENTQDYRRDLRRVEYGDERDPAMRAHLNKISPVNNVEKMAVPMLIVQGENDPRVPVTEAIQMVKALRELNQEVWYMNALNEGHGYRKKENADIYQQAAVLFLETYLVGD